MVFMLGMCTCGFEVWTNKAGKPLLQGKRNVYKIIRTNGFVNPFKTVSGCYKFAFNTSTIYLRTLLCHYGFMVY